MSETRDPDHDHSEDDLLAELDAASGADAASQTSSPGGDEELADLDAFLNEFGQSGGDGAAAGSQPEEFESAVSSPEVAALGELDISADDVVPELGAEDIVETAPADALHELDLDTEHGGETLTADALDEFVSELDEGQETGGISAPPHDTPDLFGADEAVSPHAADELAADEALIADEEEADVGRRLDVSTIGVALLSLIIAAVVGWFAVSLHSQVTELRADMGRLRQPPPAAGAPNPQLDAQLARINQRLDNLAATVTASVGHAGGNEQALNSVNTRLDDLDKSVASLRAQLIALERTPAAKPATTVATRHPAATKQPAKAAAPAKRSPVTAAAAWVVNVASLTDSKAAQSEVTRLHREGVKNTEVEKVTMNGRTWYRVRVTGFSSREEAQVYSDMIKNKLEATPWVAHR